MSGNSAPTAGHAEECQSKKHRLHAERERDVLTDDGERASSVVATGRFDISSVMRAMWAVSIAASEPITPIATGGILVPLAATSKQALMRARRRL